MLISRILIVPQLLTSSKFSILNRRLFSVEFHDKMLLICNKAIASNELKFKRFKTDLSLARHIAPTLYYLAARYQFDLNYFPVIYDSLKNNEFKLQAGDKAGEPDFQYVAHCLRHLHHLVDFLVYPELLYYLTSRISIMLILLFIQYIIDLDLS